MPRHADVNQYLRILSLLNEGYTKSKIAGLLKITPAAVTKKIKRLEKEGLIKQHKDAYPHVIKLTAKGKLALSRGNLTLSGYVRARPKPKKRPPQGVIRLHNLQVVIPILRKGRPLPLKGKNDLNNWTQYFLDLSAPINGTVEITTKSVRIYLHEVEVPRGYSGYLQLLNEVMQAVFMVHSALLKFGWIIDVLKIRIPTQHIATTMPEFDKADIQPTTVYLNRKAKGVHGRENEQEAKAWLDRSKGILEQETNDAAYEEDLLLMPERVKQLGDFVKSHEAFMITLTTETLPRLNNMLDKLNKKLDKL